MENPNGTRNSLLHTLRVMNRESSRELFTLHQNTTRNVLVSLNGSLASPTSRSRQTPPPGLSEGLLYSDRPTTLSEKDSLLLAPGRESPVNH